MTEGGKMIGDVLARGVDATLRRDFRMSCLYNGYTMRDAIVYFMTAVTKGEVKLPKKGK
jgi:hypothetical protein